MKLEKDKVYSGKDIAEWFSINPATFSRNRKQYLDILKIKL